MSVNIQRGINFNISTCDNNGLVIIKQIIHTIDALKHSYIGK